MKIGIIGLGGIAQKAYLPFITGIKGVELVLCTRNNDKLEDISKTYRIDATARTIDELLTKGIEGAFIHAATEAHIEIAEKLLNNNIHVYVDKPISYSYKDSLRMVELSESKNRILMTGFNRRFAPMYSSLREKNNINLIIMQKNRTDSPGDTRTILLDDFIHIADTLRYLIPGDIDSFSVKCHKKDGLLQDITLLLSSGGCTAIGVMNRVSGKNEETLEVFSPGNKWMVKDLNETIHFSRGEEKVSRFGDWVPILQRRGFQQAAEHFLNSIRSGTSPSPSPRDSLKTHEIVEKVIKEIEEN